MLKKIICMLFTMILILNSYLISSEKQNQAFLNLKISNDRDLTLMECLQIASLNYSPLMLALSQEEIAKLKLNKAMRALFPDMALVVEDTKGLAQEKESEPGFKEQKFGVEVSQTLFEGKKLINTRRSAQLGLDIAKINIEQTENELAYSVFEAFLNVIKSKNQVKEYEYLLADVDKYLDIANRMHNVDTINDKDYISTKVLRTKIFYKLEQVKVDYEKYLWKLATVLGLTQKPERDLYFDVDNAIKKVSSSSLSILINEVNAKNYKLKMKDLEKKSAEYQYLIRKAYKLPKFKLSGFYGESGGAYNNEDFKLKNEWQVGVDMEYVFWGNTFEAKSSKEDKSPKVGQSSRTEGETISGKLKILDGMDKKIEEKEYLHAHDKAEYEYRKTFVEVQSELQETYANFQKAYLQLKSSMESYQLAEIEYKIADLDFKSSKLSIDKFVGYIQKLYEEKIELFDSKIFYLLTDAKLKEIKGELVEFFREYSLL